MTDTLRLVPPEQLLEFPVAEDLQLGFCTGLALDDWLPIAIFPRWNFLICAANQLVNHLDRLSLLSAGTYDPRVIIRVAAPNTRDMNPGPQHSDDFTDAVRRMLHTIYVVKLRRAEDIVPAYKDAAERSGSTILVEYTELYNDVVPSGVPEIAKSTV